MTVLLDANVLIAVTSSSHIHYEAADAWLTSSEEDFATCPITQGSLLRFALREGKTARTAQALLLEVATNPRHVFWPDTVHYQDVRLDGVLGHAQVTDAYLAELARVHGGRLATFDRGLAASFPDQVDLIRTS